MRRDGELRNGTEGGDSSMAEKKENANGISDNIIGNNVLCSSLTYPIW